MAAAPAQVPYYAAVASDWIGPDRSKVVRLPDTVVPKFVRNGYPLCVRGIMCKITGKLLTGCCLKGHEDYTPAASYNNAAHCASNFKICKDIPGVIVAGGSVARRFLSGSSCLCFSTATRRGFNPCTTPSDLDLYIRAKDQQERESIIQKLLRAMQPIKACCMTSRAMTFLVTWDVLKRLCDFYVAIGTYSWADTDSKNLYAIQIINTPVEKTDDIVADIGKLLGTFDLLCSAIATDGEHLYASADTVYTKLITVPRSKIGYSTVNRMLKYGAAGFDFNIEGLKDEVVIASKMGKRMASILLREDTPLDADGTPDVASAYESKGPFDCKTHPLDEMYERYCVHGLEPSNLVYGGSRADAEYMLRHGRSTDGYISDWMYRYMGKASEEVAKGISAKVDRSVVHDAIIRSLTAFTDLLRAQKLNTEHSGESENRKCLTDEEFQRLWVGDPETLKDWISIC